MKKILYILLFVPLAMFGQDNDACYSVNDFIDLVTQENPPLSKDFNIGWNIIGYPCVESMDTELAFSSIVDKVVIIKDNNGNVYMPEFGFNGIGDLTKLNGYQVKFNSIVNDFSFCSPLSIPQVEGCTDCEALNFNIWATLNDESCNYDTDGDGVYDADEIVGCLDVLACNFDNVSDATDNGGCEFPEEGFNCWGNELSANIGDTVYGGIVFYIDSTGQHGLIAAIEDLEGTYEWGCSGTDINGNDDTVSPELQYIGTGLQNTLEIVSGCSETPIAASEALAYESGGYDDWYLPSKDEFVQMYNTIGNGGPEGNIGGFSNNYYWSSSESSSNGAWYVDFSDGGPGNFYKFGTFRVRVIRAF